VPGVKRRLEDPEFERMYEALDAEMVTRGQEFSLDA